MQASTVTNGYHGERAPSRYHPRCELLTPARASGSSITSRVLASRGRGCAEQHAAEVIVEDAEDGGLASAGKERDEAAGSRGGASRREPSGGSGEGAAA